MGESFTVQTGVANSHRKLRGRTRLVLAVHLVGRLVSRLGRARSILPSSAATTPPCSGRSVGNIDSQSDECKWGLGRSTPMRNGELPVVEPLPGRR